MRRISFTNAFALASMNIEIKHDDDAVPKWYRVINDNEGELCSQCDDVGTFIPAPTIWEAIATLDDKFNTHVTTDVSSVIRCCDNSMLVMYRPLVINTHGMNTVTRGELDDMEDALELGITAVIEYFTEVERY